jgi:DNA-binding MarR family transcriptional regulator
VIAQGYTTGLSGQAMQLELRLSSSVIVQSLSSLENQDLIERQEDQSCRIIDPLIRAVILADLD